MSFPALKILRRHAPEHRICYVTTFYAADIVRVAHLVDEVRCHRLKGGLRNVLRWWRIRREVRAGRYHPILVFGKASRYRRKIGPLENTYESEDEAGLHKAEEHARAVMRALGAYVPVPTPQIDVPECPDAVDKFGSLGLDVHAPYLVVHSGCNRVVRGSAGRRGTEKTWPTDRYAPLFRALRPEWPDLQIVLVGAANERSWIEQQILAGWPDETRPLNLAGQTNVPEMVQLLKHASCLLCGDSGVMHAGTIVRTPTVALFGPTDEHRTGPFGMGERALCLRAVPRDEAGDSMAAIGVQEVLEGIGRQLRRFSR